MSKSVALHTLGCKLNFSETSSIGRLLEQDGFIKKDFDEVQEILAEQQPMIFTVTPYYYAAARSDIGNLRPTALSYYRVSWNAEEL